MADQKISGLPQDNSPTGVDYMATIKSPFGAGSNRKVLLSKLGQALLIPAANIVSSQLLSSFSNTVGAVEIGQTVNNITLNWSYNRAPDPTSQSIDQGIGVVANNLRTYALVAQALTTNKTWTISAIGDDSTPSALSTSVLFYPKLYAGVSTAILDNTTSSATFLASLTQYSYLASGFANTFILDATVGGGNNYLYVFFPTSFGLPSSTKFGGFTFSDYTVVTKINFTNASGYSQDYYVLRTNNQYNSAGLQWQLIP